MCSKWYDQRDQGIIKSDNFQLHPPRKLNTNTFRNTCGNLNYPLLFMAVWNDEEYELKLFKPKVLISGQCTLA